LSIRQSSFVVPEEKIARNFENMIAIDSNVFLRLAFEEAGWEHCGRLLDSVYSGEEDAIISAIQISELYTPFERANDNESRQKLAAEIEKSKIRIRVVDRNIAELSARLRSAQKTPQGDWLPLADSIILATALKEGADTLYTLDNDFSMIKERLRIMAPGMPLDEWQRNYGYGKKQRRKVSTKL
jgi:predicted nucleic acid-binding protein